MELKDFETKKVALETQLLELDVADRQKQIIREAAIKRRDRMRHPLFRKGISLFKQLQINVTALVALFGGLMILVNPIKDYVETSSNEKRLQLNQNMMAL